MRSCLDNGLTQQTNKSHMTNVGTHGVHLGASIVQSPHGLINDASVAYRVLLLFGLSAAMSNY